ncbi:MAG: ABC transporter ATP-binding protein [Planctomycetes bacterium]|nr:ABC transporter ATP-binding protein [Planctomycetota bacterium]
MSGCAPILQAASLRFRYPAGRQALAGVDLDARRGELVCILGPNGSGKTTLLRCLLGLLRPSAGTITLDGQDLRRYTAAALARVAGYVPQSVQPAASFTVREILMTGRSPHMGYLGLPGDLDRRVVDAAMAMTGVEAFADRDFDALSGGERQTVMVTRALAQQPRVMLLDEPTSSLDVKHQLDIYRLMAKLAHDWEMAVVCVSHDVNLAARFADRLVLLKDGLVAAAGAPGDVVAGAILQDVYGVTIRLVDVGLNVPMVIADVPC